MAKRSEQSVAPAATPVNPDATFHVVAPAGRTCPRELSREVITDSIPVAVPNTAYYRRLISDGSLIKLSTET
jgi:hypothetical protein